MREFNTFGPVNPQRHYHVDRVAVKAALRVKIEKGRYLTLNAGRQTGKTTLFREIIAELEATGDYFGILLDFGQLVNLNPANFYSHLGVILEKWCKQYSLDILSVPKLSHQADFVDWLRHTSAQSEKRCVLIIDEFDAIADEQMGPILAEFRSMYIQRDVPNVRIVHSIILVIARAIPSLLSGMRAPYNIADQFIVPYFTPVEVADLLSQHTAETGQRFEPPVVEGIVQETEGQPFLVNRLGQLLTEDLVPERKQPITPAHLDLALARLANENNTHFASIRSKVTLHRAEVLTALFNPARYYDFQDEVTQDLIMYGIFRVLRDEQGIDYARMANPTYRKILNQR